MEKMIWMIFSLFMLGSYVLVSYIHFRTKEVMMYNRLIFFLIIITFSFMTYGIMHLFEKNYLVIIIKEVFETTAYVSLLIFGMLLWKVEK